jgi:hypothetical protein
MIYFPSELKKICEFLGADLIKVLDFIEANKDKKLYLEFERISDLGQSVLLLTYGKPTKNIKGYRKIRVQVSYLGTNFLDTAESKHFKWTKEKRAFVLDHLGISVTAAGKFFGDKGSLAVSFTPDGRVLAREYGSLEFKEIYRV